MLLLLLLGLAESVVEHLQLSPQIMHFAGARELGVGLMCARWEWWPRGVVVLPAQATQKWSSGRCSSAHVRLFSAIFSPPARRFVHNNTKIDCL